MHLNLERPNARAFQPQRLPDRLSAPCPAARPPGALLHSACPSSLPSPGGALLLWAALGPSTAPSSASYHLPGLTVLPIILLPLLPTHLPSGFLYLHSQLFLVDTCVRSGGDRSLPHPLMGPWFGGSVWWGAGCGVCPSPVEEAPHYPSSLLWWALHVVPCGAVCWGHRSTPAAAGPRCHLSVRQLMSLDLVSKFKLHTGCKCRSARGTDGS